MTYRAHRLSKLLNAVQNLKIKAVFVSALIIALLGQVYSAWHTILAEVNALPAVNAHQYWREWDTTPTKSEWQMARDQLITAINHQPQDPKLWMRLGDLYNLQIRYFELESAALNNAVDAGTYAYGQALTQRPTWIGDWYDVARLYYNADRVADPRYHNALKQLAQYGLRRPDVQEFLADALPESTPHMALEDAQRLQQSLTGSTLR